jgi:hypothetical protein
MIVLARDIRDILASKKRRKERGGTYDPIWDSLAWKSSVHSSNNLRRDLMHRILRIRYEDLVADAEHTLRRICKFLNLNYDPEMLSETLVKSTTADSQQIKKGIETSAIGKWKRGLTTSDVLSCQVITKQELLHNGYNIENSSNIDYLAFPKIALSSSLTKEGESEATFF